MDKQHIVEMKKTVSEVDEHRMQLRQMVQQNQIDSLKDTNGSQLEQLSHNKEKLKALQTELAERIKYHKKLLDKQNEEQENVNENEVFDVHTRYDLTGKEDDKKDEFHLKILDKLTMNLDRLTTNIDLKLKKEFGGDDENEEKKDVSETYSKPYFIAVCIKYITKVDQIPDMKKSTALKKNNHTEEENKEPKLENIYFNTFRISKNTTFQNLKAIAADFWKVPLNIPWEKENKELKERIETEKTIKGKKKQEKQDKYANYELLDENYMEILVNEHNPSSVEAYFQSKGSEYMQALLVFRKKETQIAVTKATENDQGKDKPETQFIKIRTDEDYMYNEFYKRFPGMKKYIKINIAKGKKKNSEGEGFLFNDNHFCVFFWILIMLILNVLSVVGSLNVQMNYRNNDNILQLLSAVPNFNAINPSQDSQFYSIINSDYYYTYLREYIATELFHDPLGFDPSVPKIYTSYVIAGTVVLRQIKIQSTTCIMFYPPTPDCSYPYYTKDLRDEGSGYYSNLFETEQATKIAEVFTGEFGVYDGSGFVQTFSPYESSANSTARTDFLNTIDSLQNNMFIDSNTIALFLQFNLYNPNEDLWTYVNLMVEVSPTGSFFAYPATLNHFSLNIYSSQKGQLIKASDVIKGIICVFLMIFILYFVFCSRQMGEFNFSYLVSFQGICNTLIVFFSYIAIYYANQQSTQAYTETELFTNVNYMDLSQESDYFKNYFISESILIALLILRCFTVFKINKRFNILIKTIESAQTDIFNYSIILFPILLGFATVAQSIYGSQLVEFSTFGRAFISILLMTVAQVNWQEMLQVSPQMTLPFILIFYLVIVFFLQSLFLGIYIDNYRTVVLELGFLYENEPSWAPKEYVKWMLYWLPKKCLKYLKLISLDENIKKYN